MFSTYQIVMRKMLTTLTRYNKDFKVLNRNIFEEFDRLDKETNPS